VIGLIAATVFLLAAVAFVLQPLRRDGSDLENVEAPESEPDWSDGRKETDDG
jgi:hypothetical protein